MTLTVVCQPEIRPEQRVVLLLGQHEIAPQEHPAQTDTLTFTVTDVAPGEYVARLRVDGVDSALIDHTATPPVFDASNRVSITL